MVDGGKIRSLREAVGISQEELGVEVGVSGKMISFIETDKKPPSVEKLLRIAQYFNVATDDLMKKPDSA